MREFATAMSGLSFRKKPRDGQIELFNEIATRHLDRINVKFPTGYGKTFSCAGVLSILKHRGMVSRLLMVVSSTTQLDQFCKDASYEFRDAAVPLPLKIIDIGYHGVAALKAHRTNAAQLFVITVQALKERRGMDNVKALLQSGSWMICVDEYHHYGLDRTWGLAIFGLPRKFLLAMSATPFRPNDDSAFGKPDLTVTYRQAQKEPAVKELVGHAYNFRVDLIDENGVEQSYTTAQIEEMAGGNDPEKIEAFRIQRKVRWSPKYVSPLVCNPIDRMMVDRLTGHKLQALVCAMCVSHAEFVCEQLRGLYPDLVIEWVGTGDNGKTKEENERIIELFCPPKDETGKRPASSVDVLVHVGIAGEGLDSTTVSEIVFLSNASISNRALQIIGRASRILPGNVIGNINFDSSSEFAKKGYIGNAIMDAMDLAAPQKPEEGGDTQEPGDIDDLPDEPAVQLWNVELLNIDSGDYSVQSTAKTMAALWPQDFNYSELSRDHNHPKWEHVIAFHRTMKTVEAREFNDKAVIGQWSEAVETAVGQCTRRIIQLMVKQERPIEQTLRGSIKRAINYRKKTYLGEKQKDLEVLKRHYNWCKALERDIKEKGIPAWCPSR
jgi:superfamily II DNA or RNA helicase